jgi:hypothetical protein
MQGSRDALAMQCHAMQWNAVLINYRFIREEKK